MLWECLECATRYAWDLQACPHCGAAEREDVMAKISRLRGPSDARDPQPDPEPVEESVQGGEQPSAGTSSEASTKKTPTSSRKSAVPRRARARGTESPSTQDPEENSSALSGTTSTSVTGGSSDAE